ncbi:nucleotide exchange factor GrpE [candidate division KSB1 bacterium]|nr:nucleotide exchange factor GrpE [candidate division KSB1 bacterium]
MTDKNDSNGADKEREIIINYPDGEDQADRQSEEERTEEVGSQENYLDLLIRLKAEFSNYKRRIERERLELADLVRGELIHKLLPILDDYDLMFNHLDEEDEKSAGFKTIYKKLMSILESEGLVAMECIGRQFDPNLHEAMLIESGSEEDDNMIVEEWQKGYFYKSKLLRAAKVKVIKYKG